MPTKASIVSVMRALDPLYRRWFLLIILLPWIPGYGLVFLMGMPREMSDLLGLLLMAGTGAALITVSELKPAVRHWLSDYWS